MRGPSHTPVGSEAVFEGSVSTAVSKGPKGFTIFGVESSSFGPIREDLFVRTSNELNTPCVQYITYAYGNTVWQCGSVAVWEGKL